MQKKKTKTDTINSPTKMISSLFLDPAFLEFHHELNLRSSHEKPFSMTDVSERGTFLWRSFSKSSLDFFFFFPPSNL